MRQRIAWPLAALIALIAGLATAPAAHAADEQWVADSLADQYELGSSVEFHNTPWVATHNSYNSQAEMGPTLSAQDSNQEISLVDQLEAGVRSLELDVHRFPDFTGAAPRVCHARGHNEGHFGCTVEKTFDEVMGQLSDWLRLVRNSDVVVLLYVEDHMDDETGYGHGAAAVTQNIGDLLYAPPTSECTEVPQDLTRNDVRDAGKQVVIVTDSCGVGAAWPAVAHTWNLRAQGRPVDYEDFPSCGPDHDRETYDTLLVRYWEDQTALTNQVGPPTGIATPDDGIDEATAAAMMRCGVDHVGLDFLSGPDDPRLPGLVWSWDEGEPGPPGQARGKPRRCVKQVVKESLPFGRWKDTRCEIKRATACHLDAGAKDVLEDWKVLKKRRHQHQAVRACERRGGALSAPRTGFEAQLLRLAMEAKGIRAVRLGLRLDATDGLRPLDAG